MRANSPPDAKLVWLSRRFDHRFLCSWHYVNVVVVQANDALPQWSCRMDAATKHCT